MYDAVCLRVVRCTVRESKKVVGDDAIMVNPTMLASWGIEPPLKESSEILR